MKPSLAGVGLQDPRWAPREEGVSIPISRESGQELKAGTRGQGLTHRPRRDASYWLIPCGFLDCFIA